MTFSKHEHPSSSTHQCTLSEVANRSIVCFEPNTKSLAFLSTHDGDNDHRNVNDNIRCTESRSMNSQQRKHEELHDMYRNSESHGHVSSAYHCEDANRPLTSFSPTAQPAVNGMAVKEAVAVTEGPN